MKGVVELLEAVVERNFSFDEDLDYLRHKLFLTGFLNGVDSSSFLFLLLFLSPVKLFSKLGDFIIKHFHLLLFPLLVITLFPHVLNYMRQGLLQVKEL